MLAPVGGPNPRSASYFSPPPPLGVRDLLLLLGDLFGLATDLLVLLGQLLAQPLDLTFRIFLIHQTVTDPARFVQQNRPGYLNYCGFLSSRSPRHSRSLTHLNLSHWRDLHFSALWTSRSVIEFRVPVAAALRSKIQHVVNRRQKIDAAFQDVRSHSRVRGIGMAHAVRVACEYRDGGVPIAFSVFAGEIVFEGAALSGAEQTQVVPASPACVARAKQAGPAATTMAKSIFCAIWWATPL